VVFPVSVLTGTGVDTLRDYLRTQVVKGRQFNKSISLTHNLLRFLRRLENSLENHDCLLQYDEERLAEFKRLVQGTTAEAKREHEIIVGLARHHAEETRHWLDRHFGAIDGQINSASAADSPGKQGPSFVERLRLHGQALAASATLRDAVLSGGETPLKVSERFNKLQSEFTRCLFQAEMRSLSLFQDRKRGALRSLEALPAEPPCLTELPKDALARRRQQAFRRVRQAVQAVDEQNPVDPVPRLPAMRALSRWSLLDRLIQGSSAFGSLLIGYHLGDLFTALILGLAGYVGAGCALAARNRARTARHARRVLDRGLQAIDQRLNVILLSNAMRFEEALHKALERFEFNLRKRRAQVEELHTATTELRAEIESFESATWLKAVEREN
jgi:hypothetical protein